MSKGYKFSNNRLFLLAKQAESRIINDNGSEETIILSAASIEAFINELPYIIGFTYKSPSAINILKEINSQRIPILFRIRMLYFILTLKEFDKGSQPYQDIDLLFSLRNMILHREIESFEFPRDENNPSKNLNIVKSFVSRGIIKQTNNLADGWSQHLLVQPVASWATITALETYRWISSLIADEESRNLIKFVNREI